MFKWVLPRSRRENVGATPVRPVEGGGRRGQRGCGIFEINETEIRREFPFNGNHGNAYRSREDFTFSREGDTTVRRKGREGEKGETN